MKTKKNLAVAFALFVSVFSFAQNKSSKTIANTKLDATKNIVQNLEASSEYSSLGKVFIAAGYKDLLSDENEKFTILAPTNTAFTKSTKEKLANLLLPVNKIVAEKVAAHHIIRGKWYVTDFVRLVRAKGTPEIKTASGEILIVSLEKEILYFTDKNGNKAKMILSNAIQTNGILHGIDNVFSPTR